MSRENGTAASEPITLWSMTAAEFASRMASRLALLTVDRSFETQEWHLAIILPPNVHFDERLQCITSTESFINEHKRKYKIYATFEMVMSINGIKWISVSKPTIGRGSLAHCRVHCSWVYLFRTWGMVETIEGWNDFGYERLNLKREHIFWRQEVGE